MYFSRAKTKDNPVISKRSSTDFVNSSKIANKILKVTSSIHIKEIVMKHKQDSETNPSIATKSGTMSAKDVDTCLMCTWTFPHSFRGEEKNTHMDRCMEGLGEEDKKWWPKCQGDLKHYMFGFDEHLLGNTVNQSRRSRKRETGRLKSTELLNGSVEVPKSTKEKKKTRVLVQMENGFVELPKEKSNKEKGKKGKGEKNLISTFEPLLKKKLKIDGETTVAEQKQIQTKVLRLPVVTELVFDPSKEFSKGSRR